MGLPARGYSWPQFKAGNMAAVKSGAQSDRIVDPIALELIEGLLDVRPDLERHGWAVMAWARAETRCLLLAQWQAEHGLLDDTGNVRNGQHVAQFERLAESARARLGLDPQSEAQLLRDQADATRSAFDLDEIRRRGREALEARST